MGERHRWVTFFRFQWQIYNRRLVFPYKARERWNDHWVPNDVHISIFRVSWIKRTRRHRLKIAQVFLFCNRDLIFQRLYFQLLTETQKTTAPFLSNYAHQSHVAFQKHKSRMFFVFFSFCSVFVKKGVLMKCFSSVSVTGPSSAATATTEVCCSDASCDCDFPTALDNEVVLRHFSKSNTVTPRRIGIVSVLLGL